MRQQLSLSAHSLSVDTMTSSVIDETRKIEVELSPITAGKYVHLRAKAILHSLNNGTIVRKPAGRYVQRNLCPETDYMI